MKRLESLDALRGFDMFFIMGGAGLLATIAAFFPDNAAWQTISEHMGHVPWDGLKHHDTIFPLFLFIAGVSFPFSLAKQKEQGKTMGAIYKKIIIRGLLLILLGMVYNGMLNFEFSTLRFCSVLGRIGSAWMFGALLFCSIKDWRKLAAIALIILVGYWLISAFIPSPEANGASSLSKEGNLACYLDSKILGSHCMVPEYDPEGLLSTIPAIATALFGMLSGLWLKQDEKKVSGGKKALALAIAGVIFAFIGWAWGQFYPINKALWSSTFVCAVAGYSLIMLALFYYIIDVLNWRKWDFFFKVIGMNSITIYLGSRFIPFGNIAHRIFPGCVNLFPESWGDMMWSIATIATCWIFLYILYRKKIFLKV